MMIFWMCLLTFLSAVALIETLRMEKMLSSELTVMGLYSKFYPKSWNLYFLWFGYWIVMFLISPILLFFMFNEKYNSIWIEAHRKSIKRTFAKYSIKENK